MNPSLTKILIGMHDYDTGLDQSTFQVTAEFPLTGRAGGENLANDLQSMGGGVWELKLAAPLDNLATGNIMVSIRDGQGNMTRIVRAFSVRKEENQSDQR